MKLSIVLPTYDEALNIENLINEINKAMSQRTDVSYEIIVVDDNSPDKTWEIVERISGQDARVKLIHRKNEKGLTSAINTGLNASQGELVSWMDCDLSHPPALLPTLLSTIDQGKDAAIASRFAGDGKDARGGAFLFQRILSSFLVFFSKILLRLSVKDVSSGYLVIKKEVLSKVLPLRGDYGEYFIDMLARLSKFKIQIVEVPYVFKNREFGESKTSTSFFGYFPRGIKYLRMIIRHAMNME